MRRRSLGRLLPMAAILLIAVGIMSCGGEKTGSDQPTVLSETATDQVGEHINRGYELLAAGHLDSAVAEFAGIDSLAPEATAREYHTACAYGRTGDVDQALAWLQRAVDKGFDVPGRLTEDQDLASLEADPRLDKIIRQAEANAAAAEAAIAKGMPVYNTPPEVFASEEELNEWVRAEQAVIRRHGDVWSAGELTLARIDLAARRLAGLGRLKAGDPEFDPALERIRQASRLSSMYEPWGAITDLVITEVDTYDATTPSANNLAEANYLAGLALAMKYKYDDPLVAEGYAQANTYLEKVTQGTEFHPAAQALMLVNKLRLPEADQGTLGPRLKALMEKHTEDETVYRIVSSQYGNEAVGLLWPISIDKKDIDGRNVTLKQYRGKVLLIDFWATWCPPCRAELPNMVDVYKKYKSKGFDVLSISLDYSDRVSPEDYRAWIDEHEMKWRHIYEGDDWSSELVRRYYVSSIPAPFLIGPDGSLAAVGDDCRGEELEKTVTRLLGL